MSFGRFIWSICLVGLLSGNMVFAQTQDENDRTLVQMTEGLFKRSSQDMRSSLHIPFQNWIRIQEAFWLLQGLIDNPNSSVALREEARRVQGLGYYIIGLYDFAATVQRKLADEVIGDQRYAILVDLAQTYEVMGQFKNAALISEQLIALAKTPTDADLNDLARRQLKAGHYNACIATVNRIRQSQSTAATRLLSARAYAYKGEFENALREIRKADNNDNREAVNMERVLGDLQTPADFWREDKLRHRASWLPSNQVPMSHIVKTPELRCSIFSILHWFGASYSIYPDVDNSAYPPNMAEDLRPGLYGFASMGAVPFMAFQVKEMNETTRSRLLALIPEIRPQRVGRGAMQPLKLDHKILYRPIDDGYIAVLVHQPWQSLVVKLAYPDKVWESL